MRLLICGSRSITKYEEVKRLIEKGLAELKINLKQVEELVSGNAIGVDRLGERWAKEKNIPIKVFIPDWDKEGKRAGILRNIEMCEYIKPFKGSALLCIHDGVSKGSLQCYNYGESIGIKVIKFETKEGIEGKVCNPKMEQNKKSIDNFYETLLYEANNEHVEAGDMIDEF